MVTTVTVIVLTVFTLGLANAVEVFRAPTELIYWDKEKAYNGYTLFYPRLAPESIAKIYLIDMEGNVVHTWPGANNPKLMENSRIISRFTEMDWDGNVVWKANTKVHHDTWRIYNPKLKAHTTIGLTREQDYTKNNAATVGCDPGGNYSDAYADGVVEVDMDGNIVWQWRFLDHVIQDKNPGRQNYVGKGKTIADYPGKLDLNWITNQNRRNGIAGVTKDWQHTNALHYNEKLDHIAINARNWSEFYVIDHGATFVPGNPEKSIELAASDAGDFIYRFGNPSAYKQGDPPGFQTQGHQQMYGSHGIEWIKDGLPGAGNFIIFDNGCYNPMGYASRVLEINPFLDANKKKTGFYVNPPDAGYGRNNVSNQIVWSFKANTLTSFFSSNVSNAQRLPNGNTLVCSGRNAHLFEITRNGEVVWEYINPLGRDGVLTVLQDSDGGNNSVFRVYRYGPDYPAFKGRELKPMGKITEIIAPVKVEKRKERGKRKGGGQGGRKGRDQRGRPSGDRPTEKQQDPNGFMPY